MISKIYKYLKLKDNIFIYLIVLFASTRICILFLFNDYLTISPDYFDQYRVIAFNILNNLEYSQGVSVERNPIYPYFLAITFFIFGENFLAVQIIQIIFDIVICACIFLIGRQLFDRNTATLSMCIWGFYPPAILQSFQIITL